MRIGTFSWVLGAVGLAMVSALAACGGNVVCPESGCNSGGGGGTNTSTSTNTMTTTTGTHVCGGLGNLPCSPDEYCFFGDGSCGFADQSGVCMPKPMACAVFEAVPWEVCGCDGTVYTTSCEAAQAGVDISANGGCMLSGGQFACGSAVCFDANSQYCQITKSDVAGVPDSYNCAFLPSACTATTPPGGPTCDCLANEPCGTMCLKGPSGELIVTCPGG
jgi:hypothetical protein